MSNIVEAFFASEYTVEYQVKSFLLYKGVKINDNVKECTVN